jgi:hypothetical protein
MPISQPSTPCNALNAHSPQQRARICEAIGREFGLEYFRRTNARREVWARLAIGLPPVPRRTVNRDMRQ